MEYKTEDKSRPDSYHNRVHRFGRISSITIGISFLMVPLMLSVFTGIPVNFAKTIQGVIGVLSLMLVLNVVEFISYTPILGASLYLSHITGNTLNMKLPAAISSMKLAEVEPGTTEGQIVSMVAIATSALTTTVILVIGMLAVSQLVPLMQSPVLKPGFDNLMYALMGALAVPMLFKDVTSMKRASVPAALAMVIALVMGYQTYAMYTSMMLPLFMGIAVLWARVLYKRDEKKKKV